MGTAGGFSKTRPIYKKAQTTRNAALHYPVFLLQQCSKFLHAASDLGVDVPVKHPRSVRPPFDPAFFDNVGEGLVVGGLDLIEVELTLADVAGEMGQVDKFAELLADILRVLDGKVDELLLG